MSHTRLPLEEAPQSPQPRRASASSIETKAEKPNAMSRRGSMSSAFSKVKVKPIIEKDPAQFEERRMDSLTRLLTVINSDCLAVTFSPDGRLMVFSNHVHDVASFCKAVADRVERLRQFLIQDEVNPQYLKALTRQLMRNINLAIYPHSLFDPNLSRSEKREGQQTYISTQLERLHTACHHSYFREEDLTTLMKGHLSFVLPDPSSKFNRKNSGNVTFNQHAEQMALAWHALLYMQKLRAVRPLQKSILNLEKWLARYEGDEPTFSQMATTLDIIMEKINEATNALPEHIRDNIPNLLTALSDYNEMRKKAENKDEETDNVRLFSLRCSLQDEISRVSNHLDAGEEKIETSLHHMLSFCDEEEDTALMQTLDENLADLLSGIRTLQSLPNYKELPVIGISKLCCGDCYQVMKEAGVTVAGTHNIKFSNTLNLFSGKSTFIPTKDWIKATQTQAEESDEDLYPEQVRPASRKVMGDNVSMMFINRCTVSTFLHDSIENTHFLTVKP